MPRLRFLLSLFVPVVYFYFADFVRHLSFLWNYWMSLIADARFLFLLCLLLLLMIPIFLSKDIVQGFFKFCGMEDLHLKNNLNERWEKVCYGIIYGSLGIYIIILCLHKPEWLPLDWLPKELDKSLGRRLSWCFGWGITGFSIAAISDARRLGNGVRSPFPAYLYFYPPFIVVNSLLIFGLMNLMAPDVKVYYPVAAFFSLNLGFWIDIINFNKLADGLLNLFGRLK